MFVFTKPGSVLSQLTEFISLKEMVMDSWDKLLQQSWNNIFIMAHLV